MSRYFRAIAAILGRDLRAEMRRPTVVTGVVLFGASSVVTLHLALAGGGRPATGVIVGALWIVLLYAALLASGRVLAVEREEGTWDALIAAPCDRSAVHAGKTAAAFVIAVVLHAVLLPLFIVLFGGPRPTADGIGLLTLVIVLADIGFASVGMLVASLTLRSRGRELLAPAIFLPLTVPLVVACVTATLAAWDADPTADIPALLAFIAAFDATFFVAGMVALPLLAVD